MPVDDKALNSVQPAGGLFGFVMNVSTRRMMARKETVRDLVEEAKKRIVLIFICVIGLAYLMSLTSSSVWINMPAAVLVIILVRYISYDLDARRRKGGQGTAASLNHSSQNQVPLGNTPSPSHQKHIDWRQKVDSPFVEAAIDQFTKHLVSEWLTNMWYKKVTPDQDAPEELMNIINGVLGEICMRAKDVNLIDLLTRDIVNLLCENLELYRVIQTHIGEGVLSSLSKDERDARLKLTLATDDKLHPALYSAEAEHKVLQRFMDGVMSFTCRAEDLQCKLFRYVARELLACAMIRPLMNLASPKFINERIESVALARSNKDEKQNKTSDSETKQSKSARSRSSTDHFSGFLDRSAAGVELVQFGPSPKQTSSAEIDGKEMGSISSPHQESTHTYLGLSAGVQSKNSIAHPFQQEGNKTTDFSGERFKIPIKSAEGIGTHGVNDRTIPARHSLGGEWAQMLDTISRRKTQALAPEHLENLWTKGRNYVRKDIATNLSHTVNPRVIDKTDLGRKPLHEQPDNSGITNTSLSERSTTFSPLTKQSTDNLDRAMKNANKLNQPPQILHKHIKFEEPFLQHMEIVEDSGSSYASEEDENNTVTGLGTPGVKVWDSKSNRSGSTSHVRHPLENAEGDQENHGNKNHLRYRRVYKSASGRKRARSRHRADSWQEVERTTFYLGDGPDILTVAQEEAVNLEDEDNENDDQSRVTSGTMASSSDAISFISETTNLSGRNSQTPLCAANLPCQQLRCKVFGADFVKSGSKTIAVYSISVTDYANHSWSIKRRFRHFEELHRRLKDFPEYNLNLPPKRIFASSLDASFVHERCNLLDKYLKDLLLLPNVADSIEVWDFLSVDSQTYMFSNSLSIIETLSVDLDVKQHGKHSNTLENYTKNKQEHLDQIPDKIQVRKIDSASNLATSHVKEEIRWQGRETEQDQPLKKKKQLEEVSVLRNAPDIFGAVEDDSPLPSEWTAPNLSAPILNLVDVIFQLQDGGWIRRQAFWVAKQVLQLGMGDAFDDWLIDKIQLLRKGEVIALAIGKIEQILWPDGIFFTKHPRRHRPPSQDVGLSVPQNQGTMTSAKGTEFRQPNVKDNPSLPDPQVEETRRAKFVRELMIDNAPAALVGLVGRKEYERCARDVYFFLQSAVCMKQLAYGLLELLLLAAFPELDDILSKSD
ncbi:hypothetical protein SUGI_0591690 [Cryptomeria japonica]|uniref:uncharacterized protein LOC131050131 isoform X2 n=1 Tax=Cryptomeria japonica TaxID=3369 RepID=UPI002414B280|nr:uncharacterized protein LOC131050131 isoform X2 [Cryptomeria japonica]GLJ29928.1 hypothetical protein SUGI_0591690 [Cryptomeria japonica]